jgi:hypothetical protein
MRLNRHIVTVVAALAAAASLCHAAKREAVETAFRKLQNLVGEWQGKDQRGDLVKTRFEPIAASTAVMETLTMPGMDDMVTIYSVDLDSIALVHYCPTNNQPRMRAIPADQPVEQLTFTFMGARNLPNPSIGHEYKLVIQFGDEDHFTERWTWRRAGKDSETVFRFVRVHSARK